MKSTTRRTALAALAVAVAAGGAATYLSLRPSGAPAREQAAELPAAVPTHATTGNPPRPERARRDPLAALPLPPAPAPTPPTALPASRTRSADTSPPPGRPAPPQSPEETRRSVQAVHDALARLTPRELDLYRRLERAGVAPPREAETLIARQRAGATAAEMAAYVRQSFPPDARARLAAMAWIGDATGARADHAAATGAAAWFPTANGAGGGGGQGAWGATLEPAARAPRARDSR